MRAAVSATPVNAGELALPTTVSVGVATWHDAGGDLREVLKRADERLYEAKRDGRDRVRAG